MSDGEAVGVGDDRESREGQLVPVQPHRRCEAACQGAARDADRTRGNASGRLDDTGNDARARRIEELAVERNWTRYQAIRYAIAAGYLVGGYASIKEREQEAGVTRSFNTASEFRRS
jgi:hypothetical protein